MCMGEEKLPSIPSSQNPITSTTTISTPKKYPQLSKNLEIWGNGIWREWWCFHSQK